MSHHQQQQQQQQQQPQQPQPPRQYQVPTTNAVQMLNDGHFLRGSSDADGTPQRSRTDSTSSETRLVDSEPLQDGPLFSGRPRQKEEQLTMTKHSYTPSKSRPQPRDVAATASSSLGAPSATLPANGSDRSSLATSPTPSQTRSQNISSESLSAAGTTVEEEQDAIRRFLSRFTCYDMMPVSVKMVVLDTQLHVKKAFFALVQNQIRSAPLWDSRKQQFVGMLTVTDFINILLKYYVSPDSKMEELEEHRIQTWRDMSSDKRPHTLACMDPSLSVLEALTMLLEYRIHRLPVIDSYTGNAISILTHKRILQFIHLNVIQRNKLKMLDLKLGDVQIGTYDNIASIHPTTPLIAALQLFSRNRVSALPIVDEDGVVIDIYAKHDVINLARERTYNNLDVTVMAALQHRRTDFVGVQTCRLSHTMGQIVEQIVNADVHRLVIVDADNKLKGVISLSDILKFLTRPSSALS